MSKTEHTPEYLLKLNELRGHTLTEEARSRIRVALSEYANFHTIPAGSVRRHAPVSVLGRFSYARAWYSGAAAIALVMALMGGTAYASEGTLPGDLLYQVKVSVAEPVTLAVAGSIENQAQAHASIAERRLEEAAQLAVKQKLDPQTSSYLEQKFSEHVDKTLAAADTLQQDGKVDASLSIRTDLEARLEAHAEVLNLVADHLAGTGASTTTLASTENLIHAIALRRDVVTDSRVALEHDRGDSASKSDTLALVTKATDTGVVTTAGAAVSPSAVPPQVARQIDTAADALTVAKESLASGGSDDTKKAFHQAQEAVRASEVASVLLKNKAVLIEAGVSPVATSSEAVATTTATSTAAAGPKPAAK